MTHPNQENLSNDKGGENDRQLLELELQKIRSEASAARLEARAAEIEIIIRRLKANRSSDGLLSHQGEDQRLRIDAPNNNGIDHLAEPDETPTTKTVHRFGSWNDLRSVQIATGSHPSSDEKTILRFDDAHSVSQSNGPVPSHHLPPIDGDAQNDVELEVGEADVNLPDDDAQLEVEDAHRDVGEPASLFTADDDPHTTLDRESIELAGLLSESLDVDQATESKRRVKPAAMLVSGLVHVGVLLILATMALQIHSPKDQVAFTASASSSEEVAMESFSIENVDEPVPETEVTEPTPVETEYEVSPIGEFKAADFATDAIVSPISSMAAAMTSQSDPTETAKILESSSASKIEFCGVEGGGNHFVYLVDSSGSMGDAFESARRELLASIDLLSPDQRFYVVFFDAQPDFMRISDPSVNEARSVYATPQNKAALRRWAMQIGKDRGKAPYDPLKFALGLRADVIFLLSDGEFPEGIPKLLQEENRVENLFGETKPISIVHTIGYFSKEGASIMTRIAKQNFGQYRHVPKP